MALGRISGPLLKANLLREGVNLAFETDLLYLDVNNLRVGINTAAPTHDLTVNGTTRTSQLEVTDNLNVGDLNFTGNTITGTQGVINLAASGSNHVVYQSRLKVDNITVDANVISTNTPSTNLEFRPTGTVEVFSDFNVTGNIHATGNITADGNITIGDTNTDNITFNADVASNIVPDVTNTYTLGSTDKRWADVWATNLWSDNVVISDNLTVDNINLDLRQGKIYYVATNGSDTYSGTHQNDPFATVKKALSVATTGDTVYVYPGTYLEEFPLTVSQGVNIRGAGLRAVIIKPTALTKYNDAFLLNGESTVEDLSVTDFFSGGNNYIVTSAAAGTTTVNVGIAPFSHTYVTGGTIKINGVTYPITNAVYTHTTGVLVLTHTGGSAAIGASVFVSNLTFSCNGSNRIFPDNGYAFRFATGFSVTSKSPYIRNVTVITRGSTTSVEDPYGFDSGDAGKGAYIDGAYADITTKEASMLFHSVTFITPNVDCITAKNGARIEWLNCFTYFANKGLNLISSNYGLARQGTTQLRISNTTGTFNVGDTVSYYDTDGSTLLASGTIAKKDVDGKIYLTGKRTGFATKFERGGKTIQAFGDAKLSTSIKKFGTASLALDGVGDYAFVASNPDFNFGTGDFTIETWVYRNNVTGNQYIFDLRTAANTNHPLLYFAATSLVLYANGSNRIIGTMSTTGQWVHVAYVRSGSDNKVFVNGIQLGSTWTDSSNWAQTGLTIGASYIATSPFNGYMDDFRVSKGIARYTTNFTEPTSILPNDQYTVLLSRFDGADASTTFVDETFLVQDVRSSSGGTAQFITLADYSDFGAEVRSIGSACVYGNYGVHGDGLGVVAYLIGQNLAYIGVGKRLDNDVTYVIQDNEITELNGAKIYYSSVDHKGDFRVGDLFYVNQADGTVDFTTASFNISSTSGLTFTNGSNVTYVDGLKFETGNLRLSGNTFESLTGPVNIVSADDQINFANNVNIAGNLDVTGNVTIGGTITLGDQNTDNINIIAAVSSDIIPNLDVAYDLGSATLRWAELHAAQETIADVNISGNTITTHTTNTNLVLKANGTGIISIPTNDVVLDQNLTVNDTSYFTVSGGTALNVTGAITQTGNVTQTGNYTQTGNTNITGNLTVSTWGQFQDIRVDGNTVSTTLTNSDLTLAAAGTGRIYVPSDNVEITNNLTVNGTTTLATVNVSGTVTANQFSTGDILIDDNYITTTIGNNNLELRAAGTTGKVYVPSDDVQFDQNLTVLGTTTLSTAGTTLDVTGTITQTGNVTQTGNYTQTGNVSLTGNLTVSSYAQFTNIRIDSNEVKTTLTNSDLSLQANGTGKILVPSNNVEITNNLTVNGTTNLNTLNVTGTVTSNAFTTGDVYIDDNYVTTTLTNSNLELRANGTGKILVPSNNFEVTNNFTVTTGTTSLKNTGITGTLTHTGNVTQTGDVNQTGNYNLTGTLTVGSTAQFKDIKVDNNTITTTLANNDLELLAAGTGRIYVPTNNVRIDNNLSVGGTTTTANINSSGTVTAVTFTTGDISIATNVIQTTLTNSNLELRAAGTGLVRVEQLDIQENEIRTNTNTNIVLAPNGTGIVSINSNQSVKLPVGTTLERPTVGTGLTAGMIRFNTTLNRFEGYDGVNWIRLDGLYDLDENTYVTAELTPGSNDNTFRFVSNGTQIADLNSARLFVTNVDVDSININNNQISATTANTDLSLQTTGTGSIKIANFAFRSNIITNTVSNAVTQIVQTGPDGYFKIAGTNGFVIPSGTSDQRPGQLEVGMTRFNTTDGRLELWDGLQWISAAGSSAGVTAAEATDITILNVLMLG